MYVKQDPDCPYISDSDIGAIAQFSRIQIFQNICQVKSSVHGVEKQGSYLHSSMGNGRRTYLYFLFSVVLEIVSKLHSDWKNSLRYAMAVYQPISLWVKFLVCTNAQSALLASGIFVPVVSLVLDFVEHKVSNADSSHVKSFNYSSVLKVCLGYSFNHHLSLARKLEQGVVPFPSVAPALIMSIDVDLWLVLPMPFKGYILVTLDHAMASVLAFVMPHLVGCSKSARGVLHSYLAHQGFQESQILFLERSVELINLIRENH
ncbi:hypothetical protein HPP92_012284 [Vanilla planifolia]|uniref:Uncharacterized protein n=1 Tax=Vanilla planifolia TaxID=51239 RepID=A0A835R2A2_VANPL|nr:hypothetical protein HPP92_012284 [Vanilla planifolia]